MAFFGKKGEKEKDLMPILPPELYETGELELRDIIAPSALKVGPQEINLGEKVMRTYFIVSYPRLLSTNWFSPIINLDKIFDISIFIHPIETAKILKKFQKKVAEVQSQINIREEKGFVRDPMLDTAYQDLEGLRDKLQQAQEKIFDVGIYITVQGDNDDDLKKAASEVRSILESRLIYVRPALFQQEEGFTSTIPINKDELNVHSKLKLGNIRKIRFWKILRDQARDTA